MQFQQNQKILISGGNITLTGPVTVGSITNPVTVANDVVVITGITFFAPLPVNFNSVNIPSQTVTGMKMILNSTAGTVLNIGVNNQTTQDSYGCTVTCRTGNNFTIIIPLAADINDGLSISITKISGAGTTVTWQLLGLSQSPVIATPPGQPISQFPLGGLSSTAVTRSTAGTTALLAAPPTATAYRLQRVTWPAGTPAGSFLYLVGHTSALTYAAYLTNTAVGASPVGENLEGQLAAEALDFQAAGTGASTVAINLFYDLIALPLIQ